MTTMTSHEQFDQSTTDELVPVLYDELRRLARARMSNLAPGNTLQPTALVHEVFVKLSSTTRIWNGRGHFFGAAARAMRQILIDQARRKKTSIHGGDQRRVDVDDIDIAVEVPAEKMLALDEALSRLQKEDPRKAEIVLLRYFAGLEREEIAEITQEVLAELPEIFRTVLVLREFEDHSYQEIADVLGISIGTVESRLFRARARFRDKLLSLHPEFGDRE